MIIVIKWVFESLVTLLYAVLVIHTYFRFMQISSVSSYGEIVESAGPS